MRKHTSKYGITARVLGRMYMQRIKYFSILKSIANQFENKKVPARLRKIVKSQAMDLSYDIYEDEVTKL